MKSVRNLLIVLVSAVLVMQLVRPPRNAGTSNPATTLGARFPVPAPVDSILRHSCYDCHSNTTVYPWYAEIQPVGWWLNSHIQDGRRDLNFDEFLTYRAFRQYRRFNDIQEQVNEGEMPLPSYLIIHRSSRLSNEQKELLTNWSIAMRDSMKAWYPADSLQRPSRRPGGERPRDRR